MLEIIKYPNKILRQVSLEVEQVGEKEKKLFNEMLFTMRNSAGVGLAAPQIGINQRIIVVSAEGQTLKLANPEIIKLQGQDKMEEGCLSVPGALVGVVRPNKLIVRGLNENNQMVEVKTQELLARVILHEIDHLNGKLIVDHMTFLQKIGYNLSNKRPKVR